MSFGDHNASLLAGDPRGTPMHIQAPSLSLASPTGPTPTAAFNLQSPFGAPYIIEEIKFRIDFVSSPSQPIQLGGSVRAQLRLGRHYITNGFIPVWLFGAAAQLPVDASPFTPGGKLALANYYVWRLPRPLIVPAGQVVQCSVLRTSIDALQGAGNATVPVVVAYSGRQMRADYKVPAYIDIPYVTAFLDEGKRVLGTTSTEGNSGENDLANPFSVPLNIQRFVGRIDVLDATGTIGVDYLGDEPRVRMHDLSMQDVVPFFTPFNQVFDVHRRTWTFQRTLPPRGGFVARTSNKQPAILSANFTSVWPMISMVGWRREYIGGAS